MKKNYLSKCNTLILLIISFLMIYGCHPKAPVDYLNESPEEFDRRMEWWRDAGFGMFIHWGAYAVLAGEYKGEEIPGIGEWIMNSAQIPVDEYETYVRQFNPQKFHANEWVKIAKNAGMKYIVITSKHHDGFCLWDSKLTQYDIVDFTPFKRDVLKELSEACEQEGIRLCFYHSIMDWHHPDANLRDFDNYRNEYLKPQVRELITHYGDIGVMWFDGEWINEWTEEQGKDLYNYIRNIKPDMIINNRVGKGRMGMQGMNRDRSYAGDFGTPEQEILDTKSTMDWESCMTMNNTWGFKKNDHEWKSARQLIHNLVDIAAKGGNYLLNVGPTAEGLIPEASIERLGEMGEWMSVNHEVIYNSGTFAFYKEGENIRLVKSKDEDIIYAVALTWPGKSLTLESVNPEEESDIQLLGSDIEIEWEMNELGDLEINLPDELQEEKNRPCKYAWTFKMKGIALPISEAPQILTEHNESGEQVLFSKEIEFTIKGAEENTVIHYTLDGSDVTANSPIFSQPIKITSTTVVKARAFIEDRKASFAETTQFINIEEGGIHCLNYSYYEGEWENLPDFSTLTPVRNGYVTRIGLGQVHPRENYFGIVYRGTLNIPESGKYIFYLVSDDGSKLYLNDQLVIDNDGLHGMEEVRYKLSLKAGKVPVRIEYFEAGGGNAIRLLMEGPGMEKQMVPAEFFNHLP